MTSKDTSKDLRMKIFNGLFFPVLCMYILNDYFNIIDEAVAAYAITSFFGIFISIMGSWWWIVGDEVSDMFKCLIVLVWGETFSSIIQLYSRINYVYGSREYYESILNSEIWKYRDLIVGISILYLFCFMIARIKDELNKKMRN